MSERASKLRTTADAQIAELISRLSIAGEAALRLPCPARDKLGDGTIGACAQHTADNYRRIAKFLGGPATAGEAGTRDATRQPISRLLRPLRHQPRAHGGAGPHGVDYAAGNVDLAGLLERLSAAREALEPLAELTDQDLDAVPPADAMKFCDGQRTLEQVVASLLTHQSHQVAVLAAALRS
jgi:hypothetical protein